VPEHSLRDSEGCVKASRPDPIPPKNPLRARRGRNRRPGRLDAPSQVAQPLLRGALLRLPRVVGEAARNLRQGEPARRGRDLLRVLVFVRAAEQDPRLEPRPRPGPVTSRPSRASVSARPGGNSRDHRPRRLHARAFRCTANRRMPSRPRVHPGRSQGCRLAKPHRWLEMCS